MKSFVFLCGVAFVVIHHEPTIAGVAYPEQNTYDIVVKARPDDCCREVLNATEVELKVGDKIFFEVNDEEKWTVGDGPIGPNGSKDPKSCECVVSKKGTGGGSVGNLGALVGRVGDSRPFVVGDGKKLGEYLVEKEGKLFLGSNDNMDECDGTHRGSCFEDNKGELNVKVKVTRKKPNLEAAP